MVRGNSETSQSARQEREMLDVRSLESHYVCTTGIAGLADEIRSIRSAGCLKDRADDRIGQIFIKKTGLKHAQRIQVLFVQEIVIVGMLGFQCRVADGESVHSVKGNSTGQVLRIGPRQAAPV